MANISDAIELAEVLAAIASRTQEAHTGRELMELVDRLLTAAGLPLKPEPEVVGFH